METVVRGWIFGSTLKTTLGGYDLVKVEVLNPILNRSWSRSITSISSSCRTCYLCIT